MSKELTPELQKQIAEESIKYESATQHEGLGPAIYCDGAIIYALKWQQAEQRADRYEKALKEIQTKAKQGIFPHLPVETMGAQMCIDIDQYITDLFTTKQTTDDTE